MHITVSASAALEDHVSPQAAGHISNDFAGGRFSDDRSLRYLNDQVLTGFSRTPSFAARLTVLRLVFADVPEINQSIKAFIHFKNNTAAVSTVATVRTARRNVLLSSEGDVPVSPFAAHHDDLRFIYEQNLILLLFPAYRNMRKRLQTVHIACLKSLQSSVFPAEITAEPLRDGQKLSSCPYLRAQSEGFRRSEHTECHHRRCLR